MPLDTQNLKKSGNFNALKQTTDIVGLLSVLWPLSKSMYLMIWFASGCSLQPAQTYDFSNMLCI
jgi:hypothetical protein